MHYFGSFSMKYILVCTWSILLFSDHFSKKSANTRIALDYVFVLSQLKGYVEKFLSLSLTFDRKSKSLILSQHT